MIKDSKSENNQCFVIMPISDPEGYETGHFRCVYEDIFRPAIEEAGFIPKRADDDCSSSLIEINIIRDIIECPMAICDLSSSNPNVLFELGVRQAFDLPVVLVQEVNTTRIFDISTINTIEYRRELIYREVIEDKERIKKAIIETKDNSRGINSIVGLLGIASAKRKENISENAFLYTISNQIQNVINKLENMDLSRCGNSQTVNLELREEIEKYKDLSNQFETICKKFSMVKTREEAETLSQEMFLLYSDFEKNRERDYVRIKKRVLADMHKGLLSKFKTKE